MKSLKILLSLSFIIGILIAATVQDVSNCWTSNCKDLIEECSTDEKCLNARKYMNLCTQKINCNQNITLKWNETCWEYCNYEATPATTDKKWLSFEKCHLANCSKLEESIGNLMQL